MKEGFDEHGEPTITELDDYKGTASPEKRKAIIWVIVTGLVLGVFYALAKHYFKDVGEKELDVPRQQKILRY
jgi:capsular polysaccharide biosynthesis protein